MAYPASDQPFEHDTVDDPFGEREPDDEPPTQRMPLRLFGSVGALDRAHDDDAPPPTLPSARVAEVARVRATLLPPPSVEVIERSGLRAAVARAPELVHDADEWLDESFLLEEDDTLSPGDERPTDPCERDARDTDEAPPPTQRSAPTSR